ncbi:MAG TPA: 4Fe-4S dicluster domain-containing protein [Xanthobacteraceae bacterium]|nr:4Fe-4S dicluster domain-containing protein [Xanthobacteraceae bacterium]
MPLDVEAVRRGCPGARVTTTHHLCRAELPKFRAAVSAGAPLIVGCTQEAPLFSEIGDGRDAAADIRYVNIRETAGWSNEAANAGAKMAALIAAAAEVTPQVPSVTLDSDGVVLICGRDETAIEAANLLKDHLDLTVLIAPPASVMPPRVTEFPVVKGRIRSAKGHLGAFELTIDDYAQPSPSSRDALSFGPGRAGAVSRCDIVLDLSGAAPLFSASDLRDGYLRADPGDPAAVVKAVLKARDLVGTFDKPRYITFTEGLCVHSRSRIVGCRRCIDLCPAGAIAPAGDRVAIDAQICAGCGQCAAVCPTGAASYALPPADVLMRKLRAMLRAYADAGGRRPIVLLHDEAHGTPLIDALARFGDGLPANVLPLGVNEVTQVGLEAIAAAFAYGASALRFLLRAKPRHDVAGLARTLALAEPILSGLGFGSGRVETIETDDPDALGAALRTIIPSEAAPRPASFAPAGGKREALRLALRELQRAAPTPAEVIALPDGAPFGAVEVEVNGCTLCLACVSACPTGALRDDPERPMVRFVEDVCVQCGLCKATCPEKVITLKPQLDFRAATTTARVLNEEEPFACIRCGKPFGVKSTIERITAALAGNHWMYQAADRRLDAIRMCADCRVIAVTEAEDRVSAAPRPAPRTTEDYLREREAGAPAPKKES